MVLVKTTGLSARYLIHEVHFINYSLNSITHTIVISHIHFNIALIFISPFLYFHTLMQNYLFTSVIELL